MGSAFNTHRQIAMASAGRPSAKLRRAVSIVWSNNRPRCVAACALALDEPALEPADCLLCALDVGLPVCRDGGADYAAGGAVR